MSAYAAGALQNSFFECGGFLGYLFLVGVCELGNDRALALLCTTRGAADVACIAFSGAGCSNGVGYLGACVCTGCCTLFGSVLAGGAGALFERCGNRLPFAPGVAIRVFGDCSTACHLLATVGTVRVARIALSGGFLCWQTDNGRQNDAVMYGALASLAAGPVMLKVQYGGYVGWERDGDCPMTLRADLGWSFGDFIIKTGWQSGFRDWPFNQFRVGLEYRLGD